MKKNKELYFEFLKYKKLYPEYVRWIKTDEKLLKKSSVRKMYLFICHKGLCRSLVEFKHALNITHCSNSDDFNSVVHTSWLF